MYGAVKYPIPLLSAGIYYHHAHAVAAMTENVVWHTVMELYVNDMNEPVS